MKHKLNVKFSKINEPIYVSRLTFKISKTINRKKNSVRITSEKQKCSLCAVKEQASP